MAAAGAAAVAAMLAMPAVASAGPGPSGPASAGPNSSVSSSDILRYQSQYQQAMNAWNIPAGVNPEPLALVSAVINGANLPGKAQGKGVDVALRTLPAAEDARFTKAL